MASNFNKDKYKSVFEQRFGKGSYDAGQSKAYNTGRLKVEARIAKDDYEKRYREYQKELEKQQKEREKAEKKRQQELEQQREMEKQREELKPKKKDEKKSGNSSSGFSLEKVFDSFSNAKKEIDSKEPSQLEANSRRNVTQKNKKKEEKKEDGVLETLIKGGGRTVLQALNPFDDVSFGEAAFKNAQKAEPTLSKSKGFNETARFANRAANSALLDIPSQLEKSATGQDSAFKSQRDFGEGGGLDLLSTLLGYGVTGAGIGAGIRGTRLGAQGLTQGVTKRNALQLGKEGASIGAIMSGTEVAGREALNPDDYNWKQNAGQIALETAGGAVLDPIISLAAPAFKQASRSVVDDLVRPYQDGLGRAVNNLPPTDRLMPVRPDREEVLRRALQDTQNPPQRPMYGNVNREQPLEEIIGRARMQNDMVRPPSRQMEMDLPPQQPDPLQELIRQAPPRAEIPEPVAPRVEEAVPEPTTPNRQREPFSRPEDYVYSPIKDYPFNPTQPPRSAREFLAMEDAKKSISNNLQNSFAREAQSAFDKMDDVVRLREEYAYLPKSSPRRAEIEMEMQSFQPDAFNEASIKLEVDEKLALRNQLDRYSLRSLINEYKKTGRPMTAEDVNLLRSYIDNPDNFVTKGDREELNKLFASAQLDDMISSTAVETPTTNPLDEILEPSPAPTSQVVNSAEIPPTFREDLDTAIRELMDEDGLTFNEAVDELRFDEYYQDFSDAFEETVSGLGGQTYTRPENDPFENYDPLGAFAGRNKGNEYAGSPIADPVRNVKATLKDHIEEVRTAFDSSIYPVKKLVKDITKQYRADIEAKLGKKAFNPDGTLKVKYNPAKGIEEIPKSISRGLDSYAKGMKPIQKLMNEYKMSDRNVSDYLVARHAKDIYADNTVKLQERGDVEMRLAEIEQARINGEDTDALAKEETKLLKRLEELKPYELPRVATEEWVDRILARFDNRPEYRKVQELYVKEQRKNLEMQLKAGLITKESFDRMVKKHPNYVSLMREVPNKKTRIRTGSGGNARSSVQERKLGSADLEIKSVFESAMRNRIAAVQAIDKNRVVQSVHNLSSIPEMQELFKKTHPKAPSYRAENVISGFVNGKQVYYEVPEAIKKSFEYDGRDAFDNVILRALQGVSTMFKRGTTNWNPAFQLMSAPREALVALNNSNTRMQVLDVPMGFLDSFFGDSLEKVTKGRFKSYKQMYRELGGEYSGFISQDQFQVKKLEEVARKGEFRGMRIVNPLARLEQFGRTMEHGTRLGEFRSAMRQGLSPEDASFEASNVINYADQGTVGRQINKFVPYFTPTMRGNIRTMQALKNNPKRAVGAALATTALPTLVYYGLYTQASDKQRSRIDNMPDYMKNNYWAVPVLGFGTDDVVLYPKPQIYAQLFANPIERALDMTVKERGGDLKSFAKDSGLDIMSKLAPPTQASLFSGALEIQANYDFFTKRAIESGKNYAGESIQFNPNMENSEKYNSYTSEPAKMLGEMTGFSPMKIDHALRSVGGTVGSDYLDVLSNLISETQGTRPSTNRSNAEILNPFRSFDFRETSAIKDYGDIMKQADKDDQAYLDRYPKEERLPVKDRPKTEAQKAYEQLKEANDRIFEINESFDLSPEEKRAMIAELRDQQRQIADWYNQQKR